MIGISDDQWRMVAAAIALGGNVRVGLEDNFYLSSGAMAKSNGELVEKAARMVRDQGRQVATIEECRARLGLVHVQRLTEEPLWISRSATNRGCSGRPSIGLRRARSPPVRGGRSEGEFNFDVWRKFGEMGLPGLPVPEKYGGAGADFVTCCLAGEAVGHAGVDGGHILAWGAHTYLCAANILQHGTEAQKEKYLPKLATGEWIGCMGLTEPGCGSDAAALTTTAVRKGDKYILNGSKTFITNAPLSEVFIIFATLDKEKKHKGITTFIVERGLPGDLHRKADAQDGLPGVRNLGGVPRGVRGPRRELPGGRGERLADRAGRRRVGPEHPDRPVPRRSHLHAGELRPLCEPAVGLQPAHPGVSSPSRTGSPT